MGYKTAGNPRAHRIRVYFANADSDTIKEGMPLCYNHDTTTNWFGGSVTRSPSADAGVVSATTTTADGSQNERRYIEVEVPSASKANQRFFAGVVAPGSWVGTSAAVTLDVYVPNGALVPVWTDKSVSSGDGAYLEASEPTVINAATADGVQIGWFQETIDRSSTAGLAWAQLQMPEMASYRSSSTLGVGLSPLLWGDAPSDAELADPGNGISYFDDFLSDHNPTTAEGWVITATTTGTLGLVAAEGGALKADSAGSTTADDGVEAQLLNCRFLPAAGTNIWFEARVKMNDATDQYFIGLAATDTTLIAAGAADDVVDKCGFIHLAASTDNKISSITARTSADDLTADVADNTDDTYTTLGFKITGITTVDFYVNGALVESGAVTANVPNAAMCLSLVSKIEGTGADAEMTVDWVKIVQDVARA
jgi:hypothetical protein